jgi:hypothetical protein
MPLEMVDELAEVKQRPALYWSHHARAAQKRGHHHQGRHGGCLQGHLHPGTDGCMHWKLSPVQGCFPDACCETDHGGSVHIAAGSDRRASYDNEG